MKIIFLCTANSCRSQIAEAWARHLLPPHWEIHSAGLITYPITRETRRAMQEVGLDMVGQESKILDNFELDDFDLVVTLSEEAGRFLPTLRFADRHWHQPLQDPMGAVGTEEEVRSAFREARDEIKRLVEEIGSANEPHSSMDS